LEAFPSVFKAASRPLLIPGRSVSVKRLFKPRRIVADDLMETIHGVLRDFIRRRLIARVAYYREPTD
jgi:hypothetical protein